MGAGEFEVKKNADKGYGGPDAGMASDEGNSDDLEGTHSSTLQLTVNENHWKGAKSGLKLGMPKGAGKTSQLTHKEGENIAETWKK